MIVVFAAALLSALVIGILQISTEEIQLMQNQVFAAQALQTAEAGLNLAFAQIRADDEWTGPITNEPFNGGTCDVTVTGTLPNLTVTSQAVSADSFAATVQAGITVDTVGTSNHAIAINNFRINE